MGSNYRIDDKLILDNSKYFDGIIKKDNLEDKYLVVNQLGEQIDLFKLLENLGFNHKEIEELFLNIDLDILFIDFLSNRYSNLIKREELNDIQKLICIKIMEILKCFLVNSDKFQDSKFVEQVYDSIATVNDWLASFYSQKKDKR